MVNFWAVAKNKQEGSSNGGSESSEPEHTPLSTSELRRKMRDPRLKGGQKQKDEDYGIDAAAAKAKQERAKGARKKGPKGRRKVQKTRTYKDAKGRTGKQSRYRGLVQLLMNVYQSRKTIHLSNRLPRSRMAKAR